uniref:Uncharacterized protein n=1 Tax=Lotharella oceanica TaxID=641309 RepID=A0A7S2TVY7_9EUKA|mmetsp:Transcript_32446/g.60350  ORF Transcript_32446/g.60350 Transcript_32446/m.60350 type:complete len:280 (+) Transcript_32446:25-864(+)
MANGSWSFLLALAAASVAAINPFYAQNLTLYHVNPSNYTGIANMNTGDGSGDAFFDLKGYLTPMDCRSGHAYPGECENPEVDASDLVVTKITLEVDSRFADYGMCNICINNTVPLTFPPWHCTNGDYVCVCHSKIGHFEKPCGPRVGQENITEFFTRFRPQRSAPTTYWKYNLATRTGGFWYSTIDKGEGSSWRIVETQRKVNATCLKDGLYAKIYKMAGECFAACPDPADLTSDCITTCVFDALLGKTASHSINPTGGLSGEEIVALWIDSFNECPGL